MRQSLSSLITLYKRILVLVNNVQVRQKIRVTYGNIRIHIKCERIQIPYERIHIKYEIIHIPVHIKYERIYIHINYDRIHIQIKYEILEIPFLKKAHVSPVVWQQARMNQNRRSFNFNPENNIGHLLKECSHCV